MAVYSIDVEVSSHDLLKAGVLAARIGGSQYQHHRVTVEADSETEAELIAAQMAVATCGYVTATRLRI